MSTYIFPTDMELQQIAQAKMPNLTQNRPIFDILPVRSVDHSLIAWEQLDNYVGLQQVRGLDGSPHRVKKVGLKRYELSPGVYGEYIDLAERELTQARRIGTFGDVADLTDLIMPKQDQLLGRRLDRIELIGWTLLTTGTFSVSQDNNVLHTDTFSPQTFSPTVPWDTLSTSTPLSDLRSLRLKHLGYSVSFGADAKLYISMVDANNLMENTNTSDWFGHRAQYGSTFNSLDEFNRMLRSNNLPQIVEYDGFYIDDNGTAQRFIPQGTGVLVGNRPAGQRVGEYVMTRNANNPGMAPGAYMKITDNGEREVPRRIQVHDGHNGGPAIYYPSAVISLSGLHS